jgi:rod shape-determining protein MreD
MNWFGYILFAGLMLILQSAAAPYVAIFGVRPDLLLVTAVFLGLFGRPREAIIGAWLLGAGADLLTVEHFGLLSLSYLLVTLSVSSIRLYVFRAEAMTQLVVTMVAAITVNLAWLCYRHGMYETSESILHGLGTSVLLRSFYTAALAPPCVAVLRRIAPVLGMPKPRDRWLAMGRG